MSRYFSGAIFLFFMLAQGSVTQAQTGRAPHIDMLLVRGGTFRMGCPGEDVQCLADERPRREVRLDNFFIGKHPVTQEQWFAVMGYNPSNVQGPKRPVEQVSWHDVQRFIERLNEMTGLTYRLPTEAEWEYAAQGGHVRKNRRRGEREWLDVSAWYNYNSGGTTHPVCEKQPNPLGMCDALGNVWEWVNDRYDKDYYRARNNTRNPRGPTRGEERVFRGCSFNSSDAHCRPTLRNYNWFGHKSNDLGFRLAM